MKTKKILTLALAFTLLTSLSAYASTGIAEVEAKADKITSADTTQVADKYEEYDITKILERAPADKKYEFIARNTINKISFISKENYEKAKADGKKLTKVKTTKAIRKKILYITKTTTNYRPFPSSNKIRTYLVTNNLIKVNFVTKDEYLRMKNECPEYLARVSKTMRNKTQYVTTYSYERTILLPIV